MTTIRAFVEKYHVKFQARPAANNPNMTGMPVGSRHWLCRLEVQGRQMTVPFSQGPGLKEDPTVEDVLDCMAIDAAGLENSKDFAGSTGRFEYEPDSRKAGIIYRAVVRQTEALRQMLDDKAAYRMLLWETERL